MKGQDLRIGNLVHVLGKTRIVKSVDRFGISYEIENSLERLMAFHRGKIKPIPLTEEKLIEFGFKSKGYECPETGYKETFPYSISLGDWSELIISSDFTYSIKSKMSDSQVCFDNDILDFVHLLQNLYYSLKREELTINN